MRFGYLFSIVAVGALVVIALAPVSAQACWFGHGGGYGHGGYGGYSGGYGYAAPMPSYPAPGAYPAAPPPGAYYTPAPGGYYTPPPPPPGTAPRPMPAPPTSATSVGAKDDSFDPATLNVQVGTTVRWTNNGKHPHTVTSNDGKWDSGDLAPGASYTVTFMTAGTYRYHCTHHKGMEGTIIVGEPGKTPVGGGTGSKGD